MQQILTTAAARRMKGLGLREMYVKRKQEKAIVKRKHVILKTLEVGSVSEHNMFDC